MIGDEPRLGANGCTSIHCEETAQSRYAHLGIKQALTSLEIVPHPLDQELPRNNDSIQEVDTQGPVVRIPERFAFIIRNGTARAAMARPSIESTQVIKDKSALVMDCGASQTITGSLINTKDVKEKVTIIETADGDVSMKSTHTCIKTYFVRNRMGEVVTITIPALFVKGLPQDLLGGKSVNHENIRVILDADPDICGLYPLDKNHEQHYQDSIEFIGEPTDLFYLQTEEMDWTTYDALTGYDLWHRRLGHVPHRNIQQTIPHAIGLESLIGKSIKKDHKCPSCMIGKSTLENYPGPLEPAEHPLGRVHMDLYSSSITSIEGYNHALIFTDSHGEFRWQFGMKTKDETFNMSKRWFAEVADLRAKYPFLVLVRDNSGENSSKEINDFFTDNGVKNYYSTPYEQWQNGLAEASVG